MPGALPGELCRIRIAHIGRSAVFAELLRVEQPSAHRVEPDCPYFPKCGGCALRHMDYAQELELKRTHVHSCLTRIGGQTLASLPITGAEQTDGYRNKVQFPVQEQNGKPAAGFFAEKRTRSLPCALAASSRTVPNASAQPFWDWMRKYSIRAYDEAAHTATSGIFISASARKAGRSSSASRPTHSSCRRKSSSSRRSSPPSRASRPLSSPPTRKRQYRARHGISAALR